jgi:hypothetical protein
MLLKQSMSSGDRPWKNGFHALNQALLSHQERFQSSFAVLCYALLTALIRSLRFYQISRNRAPNIFKQFKNVGALAECPALRKAFPRSRRFNI